MTEFRTETDSMGAIQVPAEAYWGAQTQRSLENFRIGIERMPLPLVRALGLQKAAAARANMRLGRLDERIGGAIIEAAEEVASGRLDDHFPLHVWQTGSGTQTNMNANEVIANRAAELLGGKRGDKSLVHPNDHVNRSQSSNDTIPTVLNIAAVEEIHTRLLPALDTLFAALSKKADDFSTIVKLGRTHAQDAVPLTLGQEFSGYAAQVALGRKRIEGALGHLYELAQGGTAVGTGLNSPAGFADAFAREISQATGRPFRSADNAFEAIAASDAVIECSGALNVLAASLMKIGNDLRLLASGPRSGLGEIGLPANEPGSSIMPGKVNPTQIEALTMVATQIMGNHVTITLAGSQGQFELNAYRPVLAHNILQSIRLAADAMTSFADKCVSGIVANEARIGELLGRSAMLATALVPRLGYDAVAEIVKRAMAEDLTIRGAALAGGKLTGEEFDALVVPADMTEPDGEDR